MLTEKETKDLKTIEESDIKDASEITEDMLELTNEEEKVLKKTYKAERVVFPIGYTCIITTVLSIGLDIAKKDSFKYDVYDFTNYTLILVPVIMLLLWIAFILISFYKFNSKKFQSVIKKSQMKECANYQTEDLSYFVPAAIGGGMMGRSDNKKVSTAGNILSVLVVTNLIILGAKARKRRIRKIEEIAKMYKIELKKSGIGIIIAILAIAITIATYMPNFKYNKEIEVQTTNKILEIISPIEKEISNNLDKQYNCVTHSVSPEYNDGKILIKNYPKDKTEHDEWNEIKITINEDGKVEYVAFNINLDCNLSKEENIEIINNLISVYNNEIKGSGLISGSNFKYIDNDFILPQRFIEEFTENENYESYSETFWKDEETDIVDTVSVRFSAVTFEIRIY